MKNVFLKNWIANDYGKFVFVKGAEKAAPAVPAKVEKVETGTVLDGEGADAEPSAAELAAKRREAEEARRAAEEAHAAAEAEERAEADRSLPAKLEQAAGETSEGADTATPAKTEKPADKEETAASLEETLEDIVLPAVLTSPEFKAKGEKFSASIEAAGKLLIKDFIESLSPEENQLLEGLGLKLKTLSSQERVKTSKMAGQELGLAYMYGGKVEGRKTLTPFAKDLISAFRKLDENPDTMKKFTKFLESAIEIGVKETEKFYDSLSPEEKQGVKDFDKKVKTLPPDKQIQHYKKAGFEVMVVTALVLNGKEMYRELASEPGLSEDFKSAMRSLGEHTDEAAEKGAEKKGEKAGDEDDEEEEGKKEEKKGDEKAPDAAEASTVVEAAKEGGFAGIMDRLVKLLEKLGTYISDMFGKMFDGFTPKLKKSPMGGTEKFTISTAEKGVDLKAKTAGLDATWIKDSPSTVISVDGDTVQLKDAAGIVTYKGLDPVTVSKGDVVKPEKSLGKIKTDTLNLQMTDSKGKDEDLKSLLRGFEDKTESSDDKLPDFSATNAPIELGDEKPKPNADMEIEFKPKKGEQVKMISAGVIKSVSEDGAVTIACKGKTEIKITGLDKVSIPKEKKGKPMEAGEFLGLAGTDGIVTMQILKGGVPQDPYKMGLTDYLEPKAEEETATPPAAEAPTPAPQEPAEPAKERTQAPVAAPTATLTPAPAPTSAPSKAPAAPVTPTATPTPATVEAKSEKPTLEQQRIVLLQENLKAYIGKTTPISEGSSFKVELPFIENGAIVKVPCEIKADNKVEVGGVKYDLELPASAKLISLEIPKLDIKDGTAILTASKFGFSDKATTSLAKMLEMLDALRKGPATLPVTMGDKSATFRKTA